MRLSEYQKPADIPQCCLAVNPGRHCPMFGVSSVLRSIEHLTVIYLGTTDCVYFAQKAFRTFEAEHPDRRCARVLAAELTEQDLVFGLQKSLTKLITHELEQFPDHALYLVTSCSIEVISEDIQGTVEILSRKFNRPITLIPTENFKTFSYYTGIENALAALACNLNPVPILPKTFGVLGARFEGGDRCEPVRRLQEYGYRLLCNFPFQGTKKGLAQLNAVSFHLVIDNCAVKLAQELKSRFGIEYVRFDEKLNQSSVQQAYRKLSKMTGLDFAPFIEEQERALQKKQEVASRRLRGKTFFYSQILLYPFEACLFLARLGAIPTCIFLSGSLDRTDCARKALLQYADPELLRNAQSDVILKRMQQLHPDFFIGGMLSQAAVRAQQVRPLSLPVLPLQCGYEFMFQSLERLTEVEVYENP